MNATKRAKLESELNDANRRVHELRAQLASTLGAAFDAMPKAGEPLHGSAVILELTAIGGRQVVAPVAIRDGLSPRTIAAIQDDLRRSFELATIVSVAMANPKKES